MRYRVLLSIAALAPATAHAAASAQPPQQAAPAAIQPSYLQGRWCETNGSSWMSVDTATRQINLPNGNTGQRVVGTYVLTGSDLAITGPRGARINVAVRRVDARSMYFTFGNQPALLRRC